MKNLLVICGPTATGKTSLGVFLAKEFKGEVISADSRQVYQGLDIGTGKDIPLNSKFVNKNQRLGIEEPAFQVGFYLFKKTPVWLLDVVRPDYRFSAADYVQLASKVIKDIWRRQKLPLLVGGTGFYIQSLIKGIGTMGVKPDWELRKKLAKLTAAGLARKLKVLDSKKFQQMNQSDQKNPRRLIRALEVVQAEEPVAPSVLEAEVFKIGLTAPNQELYRKIDQRVEKRVRQGAEAEVKSLLDQGYNWQNSALGATLGYQEWQDYFEKKATREEVIRSWQLAEHGYARRQKTWFKRDPEINWFAITQSKLKSEVVMLVKDWYIRKETKNDREN